LKLGVRKYVQDPFPPFLLEKALAPGSAPVRWRTGVAKGHW